MWYIEKYNLKLKSLNLTPAIVNMFFEGMYIYEYKIMKALFPILSIHYTWYLFCIQHTST